MREKDACGAESVEHAILQMKAEKVRLQCCFPPLRKKEENTGDERSRRR